MPALHRTIIPRIRKSLEAHGIVGTVWRCLRAPFYLWTEVRVNRRLFAAQPPDAFDLAHNVETSQRVHQSDLSVDSDNWAHGTGYLPTSTAMVEEILAGLPIRHEDFTFIDLGSGKGRVLFVASDYPFRAIIGVEYAPSLHKVAVENIRHYRSETQKCRSIESRCGDITQFSFPETPLVVFCFNPAREPVMQIVASNLLASFNHSPRETWVVYVNPLYNVFDRAPLRTIRANEQYAIYSSRPY